MKPEDWLHRAILAWTIIVTVAGFYGVYLIAGAAP